MKKFLLTIICLFSIGIANAQTDIIGGVPEHTYESNLSKDQLWSNLKRWVSTSFRSYKHTVDMEDKEAGIMIIKFNDYQERFQMYLSINISATLQIEVKDNKWRYKIMDAEYALGPNSSLDNISYMSTNSLQQAKKELEAAQDLSYRTSIPDGLAYYINKYSDKLKTIPQYKKPKDEAKGKENKEYTEVNFILKMAEHIKTVYSLMTYNLKDSLEKGMQYTSDF